MGRIIIVGTLLGLKNSGIVKVWESFFIKNLIADLFDISKRCM